MKTILITGATSGFGKGLVRRFLEEGHTVIATGRNLLNRPELLQKERAQFQNRLIEKNLDVTSKSEILAIADYFKNQRLDVLINNAGYAVFGPAEECSEDKIRQQFEVNFFGLVLLTQKLLPFLRQSKGHIVNFSSVFGFTGFPLTSLYCASKFAVEGFSESLSHELRPFGVKVTLIQPGGYRTNFNDNAVWGMADQNPTSAYHKQIQNYASLRQKMATRPNPQNPEEVVEGVVRIVNQKSPGLSYTFGKDAFFTKMMKRLFPRAAYHRLTGFVLGKLFNKELA